MDVLTIEDIRKCYPARYRMTKANLALAQRAMDGLWLERCEERGAAFKNRSKSCKFASLLARSIFGGRLDGNWHHVFVTLPDKQTLDLNAHQEDVIELTGRAYVSDPGMIEFLEYRESLGSCLARVNRWVDWFEAEHKLQKKASRTQDALSPA